MKKKHATHGPCHAFTLVELLVVVAMIALLIALLLPSLQRARYTAKQATCAARLGQVGSGLSTYTIDNRSFYPIRGAIRNFPETLANGDNWDVVSILEPYFSGINQAFRCPLVTDDMKQGPSQSSYGLLFNTRGSNGVTGSIGGYGSPPRLIQYDVDGRLIADGDTSSTVAKYQLSQFQTWYYPVVDPRQLLRKPGQTWTATATGEEYTLLAMDRFQGRGHPVRSRQVNHPEPGQTWTEGSTMWQGPSGWNPPSSANYLGTDGHVVKEHFPGSVYWSGPPLEDVTSITGVGLVPNRFAN